MRDARFAIAVVQMDCVLGETEPNLNKIRHFAGLAASLGADLAIFPECATTGYFVGERIDQLAEPPDGPASRALGAIAKENRLHLACGLYTKDEGAVCNSQQLFAPDGRRLATYHKAHLFAAERNWYRAGDRPVVVETGLGKLGMTICYDLLFPEYVRRLIELGADMVINSTNWINDPYQRDVWGWTPERTEALASVRALENVAFVAMSCRVGHEAAAPDLAFDSFGPSCVAAPSGKILARLVDGEGVAVARVDIAKAELERWSAIATYRKDRRPELYR
jgi:predicted amidohydrolase